jgi:hypothetical protein
VNVNDDMIPDKKGPNVFDLEIQYYSCVTKELRYFYYLFQFNGIRKF